MTLPTARVGSIADDFFRSFITAREQSLAVRETIPVCPFEWGFDALAGLPGFSSLTHSSDLDLLLQANHFWLANLDLFFAHNSPTDFQLHGHKLQFSSAVQSLYPENNTVCAEYFPCRKACGRAVLVLPHWNAVPDSYATFCRYLNWLGFSALLLTLPYHGNRKPRECIGAEYSVSPNLGRTIACARQGVIDTFSGLDWLTQRGYSRFAIVGSSLGFGHAFIASALDQRLAVNAFNLCCSTVSDALWVGMPQYRQAMEPHISQQELRECWSVINPISYFNHLARVPKKSLIVLGRYDTTFARNYVEEALHRFHDLALSHKVVELPCGHRTIGDTPYAILTSCHIGAFLRKNL